MIHRWSGLNWPDVEAIPYKDRPGSWQSVSRKVLFSSERSAFETRYFEVGRDGYTSHEQHAHEHCVVVLQGTGEVLLNETWEPIGLFDVVIVESGTPHQFRNTGDGNLGILCIVDRIRDRPVLLHNTADLEASQV